MRLKCNKRQLLTAEDMRCTMKFAASLQCIWIILCVKGDGYPQVSFLGENLLNHSYVNLSLVGDGVNDVKCLTDLVQCCSSTQGNYRGDWWFPNGNRLEFSFNLPIFERRFNRTVVLRKSQSLESLQVGIYRCSIPTNDVHDADDIHNIRALFYVGLYADGGNISILGEINLTFHSVETAAFTLTCISTGGPATTVIWTRDSIIITDGNKTVLNDPVTARYTHTLTVTRGPGGIYQCNVTNNKPSWATKSITLRVNPVQRLWVRGATQTSLILSWTATNQSAPLATGYRLQCVPLVGDRPPPGFLDLSISSTEMTGLLPGVVFNCCLTVTSLLSDSESVCVTNSTHPPHRTFTTSSKPPIALSTATSYYSTRSEHPSSKHLSNAVVTSTRVFIHKEMTTKQPSSVSSYYVTLQPSSRTVYNEVINNPTNDNDDHTIEAIIGGTTSLFLMVTILVTSVTVVGIVVKCCKKKKYRVTREYSSLIIPCSFVSFGRNDEPEVNTYATTDNADDLSLTNSLYKRYSTHNKGSAEPYEEWGHGSNCSTSEQRYHMETREDHENVNFARKGENSTKEECYENVAFHKEGQKGNHTHTERNQDYENITYEEKEDYEDMNQDACSMVYEDVTTAPPRHAAKMKNSVNEETEAVYANTSFHTLSETEMYY